MEAVLVRNADRMMMVARPLEQGIELSFADGCRGLIPFGEVPEIKGFGDLSSIELPNPYEMIVGTVEGKVIEIPWDFARHYCDQSYRPTVESIAARGRQALGERVEQLRESVGLTQDALAAASGIGRTTLVEIEEGQQAPNFRSLEAIAKALGKHPRDLLADPEFLLRDG
jgi:DNA-binding XRE family transcriptional regulator